MFLLSLVDRFDTMLQHERDRPQPSLLRACRLMFGREFLNLGWFKAANTGLGFSGPLLLKVVVNAVQDASKPEGVKKNSKKGCTVVFMKSLQYVVDCSSGSIVGW